MEILKVSTKSEVNKVAGAIAHVVTKDGKVEIQAVGAGAVNQALKAIIIARGFVATVGEELVCTPGFMDVTIEEEKKTAIKIKVETRY